MGSFATKKKLFIMTTMNKVMIKVTIKVMIMIKVVIKVMFRGGSRAWDRDPRP